MRESQVPRRIQRIQVGENPSRAFGPGERLGIGIVFGDVAVDRCLEIDDRLKAAALGRRRVSAERQHTFLKVDTQGFEAEVLAGARELLPRLQGIQLEISLVRCYEGERDFRELIDDLERAGFSPWLFLPGYFEPKLARQLQLDGVFMRSPD
jgi:Methyltransferase FkbM domain